MIKNNLERKDMKKYICALLVGTSFLITSCSQFTDLQPKGKNLLSTTEELTLLLNREFQASGYDVRIMVGDIIYASSNVPNLIKQPNKSRNAIIISWDEANQDRMAELTESDTDYGNYYGYIGTIANPVLSHVDETEGEQSAKDQLKCEALVMRAYYHYLLVNKFAKAYNPATAATDPGIPYMLEDQELTVPAKKKTVQEVYELILKDVEKAIELDALPTVAVNRMRMCKPCAYAVKALALMSMQEFDQAEEAAKQALELNNTVNNYNEMLTTMTGYMLGGIYTIIYRPRLECEEDLFYVHNMEFLNALSPETWDAFEEGHVCRDKMAIDLMDYDYLMSNASMIMGLDDYVCTNDYDSGWNVEGMKTTHMYLIVAEAEIHKGNYSAAMQALDAIRINRIDPLVYAPLEGTVTTEADAIAHLKQTSHGENIYSIYNFLQVKRWNQLEGYKETRKRTIAGEVYTLSPESPLWIFPFPANATSLNSNLTQNYSIK